MSYCRWSSNFCECDVYVYEHCEGGWTTHVAGRRLKHRVPDEIKAMCHAIDWKVEGAAERYMAYHAAEEAWRESLPCDEFPCHRIEADGSTSDGTMKTPKDSEYMPLSDIGDEAGETFSDSSPGDCADRLEQLASKGFLVPAYVIVTLREEQAELDATEQP